MIVAGIGCRSGVSVEEVDAALEAALTLAANANPGTCDPGATAAGTDASAGAPGAGAAGPSAGAAVGLAQIATAAIKASEPAIAAAARNRGVPLMLIPQTDLETADARTLTRSRHSLKATNVHSVAEAAALAAAGTHSRLLLPRIKVGAVTCALATTEALVPTARQTDAAGPTHTDGPPDGPTNQSANCDLKGPSPS